MGCYPTGNSVEAGFKGAAFAINAILAKTSHDFHGFPRELYEVQYPAPASSGVSQAVHEIVCSTSVRVDHPGGLGHGTWPIWHRVFPCADVQDEWNGFHVRLIDNPIGQI
jgi:aromatic ring-opening dioxygenase catalytic subunit (LigB family)